MRKYIVILVLVVLLFMTGCGEERTVNEVFTSNSSTLDQSNLYYVVDHSSIHYMNFKTGESGFLCYDPLCSHQIGECQACISDSSEYMANIAAVKDNCVYYVKSFENDAGENEGFGIVEYDATARTTKVLFKGMPDLITQFVVRGNDIYYFMNAYAENGNGIRNIYRYSLKDKKSELLTEGIEQNLLFYHSDGENVYLEDLDLGIVYQTDWTFQEMKEYKVFDSSYTYFYFYDEYFYYFENSERVERLSWTRVIDGEACEDEEPFLYDDVYVNLVRVPLADVNAEPQIVLEHVVGSANLKFYNNHMVCILKNPSYYKTDRVETIDPETGNPTTVLRDVYAQFGDLVTINLNTLETSVLFPGGKYDISNVYYWDAETLVFYGKNVASEVAQPTTQAIMEIVRYDLVTGETTVLWEHGK